MKSNILLKIFITIASVAIFIMSLIAIWYFPCENLDRYFGKFNIPVYDTGIVLVHINGNGENCLITHYNTIGKAFSNAENGDTVYVLNQKNEISSNDLYVLKSLVENNKSVTVKFLKISSIYTINIH